MKKIQQYKIIKLESGRLRECKYKIESLSFQQAIENGEVVSLADSELIRILRRVKGQGSFSRLELDSLATERKTITRKNRHSKFDQRRLVEIDKEIEGLIFIPEIVTVYFDNKKHYSAILKLGGFHLNGKLYVPLLSGAGMMRRSSVMFIESSLRKDIDILLNNGRNELFQVNPAKFASYYALASSASLPVTFPRIAIVPDKIIKTIRTVDFGKYVGDGIDPIVEEREMEMECNAFDGQGIVTPEMAKIWSSDLELDYTMSSAIVRSSWLKGLVVVFPIHELAKKYGISEIIDVYGNKISLKDVDCFISESMFKLWGAYESAETYVDSCQQNGFGFGISRVNPKESKTHARSSYQFIQVLDMEKREDIRELASPTLDWILDSSSDDRDKSLLYMLGEQEYSDGWFDKLDPTMRAILINAQSLSDEYIISKMDASLGRKKKDARIGRLMFRGCYSTMISDPYYQASHILGMNDNLLSDGEYYSKYWNDKGIKEVVAIRSPIVHSSEINKLKFRFDEVVSHWYRYIQTGIIYPAYGVGIDPAIHGGSDFDGDEVCTIDNPIFLNNVPGGKPVLYESKKANKEYIPSAHDENIYKSQIRSFGTHIGYYTNVGSSAYCLLRNFKKDSPEYEKIMNRLKYFRVLQGEEIDAAKTGNTENFFPEHFVKYKKITDEMSVEEKRSAEFNNSILADKRPLFMRWLYPDYQRKYKREVAAFDGISLTKWKLPFIELLESSPSELSEEQEKLVNRYRKKSFFISNDSIMNVLSSHVDKSLRETSKKRKDRVSNFDPSIYLSSSFKKPKSFDLEKMSLLYREYRSRKRSIKNRYGDEMSISSDDGFDDIDQINKMTNKKAYATISASGIYLGDLAVYWGYYNTKDKNVRSFVWNCFGDEIVENMKEKLGTKSVRVPQKSKNGTIEYLWSKYSIFNVSIE